VPAAEELGRRFGRPAFGAFTTDDLDTAFDLFMRGVCGERYRSVLEQRLGENAVDEAIRQSAFFFRDEAPAVLESTFGAADGARIHCPVTCRRRRRWWRRSSSRAADYGSRNAALASRGGGARRWNESHDAVAGSGGGRSANPRLRRSPLVADADLCGIRTEAVRAAAPVVRLQTG